MLSCILLISQSGAARNWFEIFSDSSYVPVNDVTSLKGDLQSLLAAGDNGYYFRLDQPDNYYLEMLYTGFPENLNAIGFFKGMYGQDSLLLTAGDNGRVLYFDFLNDNWYAVDTLGTENFRSVFFDFGTEEIYLAGDNSTVYISSDYGRSWTKSLVEIDNLDNLQVVGNYNGTFIIGVRGDTTFIMQKDSSRQKTGAAAKFAATLTDTIPGFKAAAASFIQDVDYNQFLYIAGNTIQGNDGQVWVKEYLDNTFKRPILYSSGIGGTITDIAGSSDYSATYVWITTREGDVWESVDKAKSWYQKYTDPRQRKLGPMFILGNIEGAFDIGRIFGAGGVLLKYGFELRWFEPPRNAHVDYDFSRLELRFSSPAELDSVRKGVFLSSNISGNIPFNAEYDPGDSSIIYLNPSRPQTLGTVPGESWQVIVSDRIREAGEQNGEPFNHFNYRFDILPFQGSDFDFQMAGLPFSVGKNITNPVVGFFDTDDTFDVIFYGDDTLYCFNTDSANGLYLRDRLSIPTGITLSQTMENQLVVNDINRDGLPDLLLYDNRSIYIIENHSSAVFDFRINTTPYSSQNIKQIIPYSADNNELTDLLVLNDTLYTLMNISLTDFGQYKNISDFSVTRFRKMVIGDIDLDGFDDLVWLDEYGSMQVKRGGGYGYFYDIYDFPQSGIRNIFLADLDNDFDLEVLAAKDNEIYALQYKWEEGWAFYNTLIYNNPAGQNVRAMTVHNFGNNNRSMGPLLMDIALISGDSLKLLENRTFQQGNYQFFSNPKNLRSLPFTTDGFRYADFNKDGFLDFLVYNQTSGEVAVFQKQTWRPVISDVLYPHKRAVEIRWDPPPNEEGIAQFYRVARDSTPFINEQSWIREVYEPFFVDSMVSEIDTYWYSVAVVFEDGSESAWSEPVPAQMFIELNDPLTNDLTDSNRVYYARTNLSIPAGTNINMSPGVTLVFDPGTGLDVFGGLHVEGDWIEDKMVEFYGANHDEVSWNGITLHPATDTVQFIWFAVSGAQTAIRANQRPLKLSRGGLQFNFLGLEVDGDTLSMTNILLDSNMTAASLTNCRADIKNITLTNAFESALYIGAETQAKIRNSIFWFNNGPSIISEVTKNNLKIAYSTVDSIAGSATTQQITREAPIFMPPDSGFFRMDYNSPTVDAGFPGDDVGDEPPPNGGVINQGVFGGLVLAAPTVVARLHTFPEQIFQQIRPGNSDTAHVYISNSGGEPLELNRLEIQGGGDIFRLTDLPATPIQPGDTVALPIIFTPDARMDFVDTLVIESNDTRVFYRVKTIALFGRGLNSPPEISGTPPGFVRVDEPYEYTIQAHDADGDSLIFSAVELPAWLTLSPQGVLSGTPGSAHIGKHAVRVEISDGFGGTALLEYEITVLKKDDPGLLAPRVILTEFPDEIVFQSGIRLDFIVTDNDDNPLGFDNVRVRYFLHNDAQDDLPVITDTSGISSVSYVNLEDGQYLFKIWAYDSLGRGYEGQKADSVHFEIRTFQRQLKRHRWYLMSFPRGQTLSWNDFDYPDSAAMLLVWDNQEEDYLPMDRANIEPGNGFWVMPMQDLDFDLSAYERLQPGEHPADILTRPLQNGWNQVGTPVDYSTAWKNMIFHSDSLDRDFPLLEAVQAGLVDGAVHWFLRVGDKRGYILVELDSSAIAYPWLAYWFKTRGQGTITFTTEPNFKKNVVTSADSALGKPLAKIGTGWRINIGVENESYTDPTNILGAGMERKGQYTEPPPFGDYCAFYFTGNKGRSSISYKADDAGYDNVLFWDAVVETRSGQKEHHLKWDVTQAQEQGVHLFLLDRQTESVIPMDRQNTFTFKPGQRYYKFRIYASTDAEFKPEIIPLSYRLEQNYPNPFNPQTTIRFGLPEEAEGKTVQLKVYDILGREVKTLLNGRLKAGYHEVRWNGRNNQGQTVSSGVYFYRLQTGQTTQMARKMILLR